MVQRSLTRDSGKFTKTSNNFNCCFILIYRKLNKLAVHHKYFYVTKCHKSVTQCFALQILFILLRFENEMEYMSFLTTI